jgi:hypothetical protein
MEIGRAPKQHWSLTSEQGTEADVRVLPPPDLGLAGGRCDPTQRRGACLCRRRRGSTPPGTCAREAQELQHKGEISRDENVEAVSMGNPGPDRSDQVPGSMVDRSVPMESVAQRTMGRG